MQWGKFLFFPTVLQGEFHWLTTKVILYKEVEIKETDEDDEVIGTKFEWEPVKFLKSLDDSEFSNQLETLMENELFNEEMLNVNGAFTLPISLAGAEADTYFIQIKTTKNKWYAEFDI